MAVLKLNIHQLLQYRFFFIVKDLYEENLQRKSIFCVVLLKFPDKSLFLGWPTDYKSASQFTQLENNKRKIIHIGQLSK